MFNQLTGLSKYGKRLLSELGIPSEDVKCKTQPQSIENVHACIDVHTHVPEPVSRTRQRIMLSGDFSKVQKHDIIRSLIRYIMY